MGAAAQLEAVVVDADRADRLAVLLVEEGVRPGRDRLGHRQEGDAHRPILADDPPDFVLDAPPLVVGQGPVEGVVEAEVVGRDERPGLPRRAPTTLRSARCRRCVAVWLRIVRARRSASTAAATVDPTRSRPWSVPRWTIRPPDGFWVSVTVKSGEPPPGSRISPRSPTCPPPSA